MKGRDIMLGKPPEISRAADCRWRIGFQNHASYPGYNAPKALSRGAPAATRWLWLGGLATHADGGSGRRIVPAIDPYCFSGWQDSTSLGLANTNPSILRSVALHTRLSPTDIYPSCAAQRVNTYTLALRKDHDYMETFNKARQQKGVQCIFKMLWKIT